MGVIKHLVNETTHTPQGDGNFSVKLVMLILHSRNNLHPARGRKLSFECACNLRFVKIPRKGTETPPCMCRTLSTNRNTPYPVRGRKLLPRLERIRKMQKQLTPRRGTETDFRTGNKYLSLLKQPTPRKGTESLLSKDIQCPKSKQPTPRKRTETFL